MVLAMYDWLLKCVLIPIHCLVHLIDGIRTAWIEKFSWYIGFPRIHLGQPIMSIQVYRSRWTLVKVAYLCVVS